MADYCFGIDIGGTTVKSLPGQRTGEKRFFLMWRKLFVRRCRKKESQENR